MIYDTKTWFLGIFTNFLCFKSDKKWVPSNDCLSLNKIKDVAKCSEIGKLNVQRFDWTLKELKYKIIIFKFLPS